MAVSALTNLASSKRTASCLVRPYAPADYPVIAALWRTVGVTPFTETELARVLAMEGGILIAEQSGAGTDAEVIGVVLWTHNGRNAFVWRLAVAERHRGRGVATALLHQAERDIQAAGFAKVGLLVRDYNATAKALYTRHGWSRSADLETWWKTLA